MTVVVMLFQTAFKTIAWLAMPAKGTRFGGGWHAYQVFVIPDLVPLSFLIPIHSFYSTNIEYQLCVWPEKTWSLPKGA